MGYDKFDHEKILTEVEDSTSALRFNKTNKEYLQRWTEAIRARDQYEAEFSEEASEYWEKRENEYLFEER